MRRGLRRRLPARLILSEVNRHFIYADVVVDVAGKIDIPTLERIAMPVSGQLLDVIVGNRRGITAIGLSGERELGYNTRHLHCLQYGYARVGEP